MAILIFQLLILSVASFSSSLEKLCKLFSKLCG